VQVPDNGQPIVIMPDGPTVGGYPKIAVVIRADLRLLAQSPPGTRVRFVMVSLEEARRIILWP
jgi:allophanate hydrolase